MISHDLRWFHINHHKTIERGDITRPAVVPYEPSQDDRAECTVIEQGDITRPAVVPSEPSQDDRAR